MRSESRSIRAAIMLTAVVASLAPSARAETPADRGARVLTRAEQAQLTPGEVLERLREGNRRFVTGTRTVRDHSAQVRAAVAGQHPKAIVLSCIDSRIPVEDVFDQGIGDVFVARVAGNFENTDILGSMEYACKVVGAKLILVLGHENCGAVKAAIDGVVMGNLTAMLENIEPAVNSLASYPGEKTSANPEFVHLVAERNVRMTMTDILERSPILGELVSAGDLGIAGALYSMQTGEIEILD